MMIVSDMHNESFPNIAHAREVKHTIVCPIDKKFEDFWILIIEKDQSLLSSHSVK